MGAADVSLQLVSQQALSADRLSQKNATEWRSLLKSELGEKKTITFLILCKNVESVEKKLS